MPDHKARFTNANNVPLMRNLFFETSTNRDNVVYTLKDEDHEGYPSLYRLYIEAEDTTEYLFATKYVSSWNHWKALCAAKWFQPFVQRWREELELKLRAEALAGIIKTSRSEGREAYQARKYVAEGWGTGNQTKGAGRPSKAAIASEAKKIAQEQSREDEDYFRLIQGGQS